MTAAAAAAEKLLPLQQDPLLRPPRQRRRPLRHRKAVHRRGIEDIPRLQIQAVIEGSGVAAFLRLGDFRGKRDFPTHEAVGLVQLAVTADQQLLSAGLYGQLPVLPAGLPDLRDHTRDGHPLIAGKAGQCPMLGPGNPRAHQKTACQKKSQRQPQRSPAGKSLKKQHRRGSRDSRKKACQPAAVPDPDDGRHHGDDGAEKFSSHVSSFRDSPLHLHNIPKPTFWQRFRKKSPVFQAKIYKKWKYPLTFGVNYGILKGVYSL